MICMNQKFTSVRILHKSKAYTSLESACTNELPKKGLPRFLINAAAPVGPDLQAAAEPAQTERPVRLLQVPDPDYSTLSFVFYGR